jgi:RimJ/RimL family protein N-acetyltransferase
MAGCDQEETCRHAVDASVLWWRCHAELVEVPGRAGIAATDAIRSERLSLVLMDDAWLEALARGDRWEASELQGVNLPSDFPAPDGSDDEYIRLQREKLRAYPEQLEWCARLMVRISDRAAVGHCGFHGPPRALGRAEIGYTVFPAHRGQGFATEAAAALVAWAWEQGERTVVASVPPSNLPSLAVVRKVGFVQTGVRVDDVYNEQLVFEVTRPGA